MSNQKCFTNEFTTWNNIGHIFGMKIVQLSNSGYVQGYCNYEIHGMKIHKSSWLQNLHSSNAHKYFFFYFLFFTLFYLFIYFFLLLLFVWLVVCLFVFFFIFFFVYRIIMKWTWLIYKMNCHMYGRKDKRHKNALFFFFLFFLR